MADEKEQPLSMKEAAARKSAHSWASAIRATSTSWVADKLRRKIRIIAYDPPKAAIGNLHIRATFSFAPKSVRAWRQMGRRHTDYGLLPRKLMILPRAAWRSSCASACVPGLDARRSPPALGGVPRARPRGRRSAYVPRNYSAEEMPR